MSENCNHDCSSCSANCSSRKIEKAKLNDNSSVRHVIGIVSGKGGVGKSLVTSLLAVGLNKGDSRVGVIDADITGPSIPQCFGIHERAIGENNFIYPALTNDGIEIISSNMFLENDDDPIIWRGSMISTMVTQFYTDVLWTDIDYLLCDMPPGTGDVPLTIFQQLPVDGIVIVTSPQELVSMIVKKAVKMANTMNVPILGIVENMSYVECPNCNEKIEIYGKSHIEDIAKEFNIEVLGRIPLNPNIAKAVDEGKIEELDSYKYIERLIEKVKNL